MKELTQGIIPKVVHKLDWDTWLEKFEACTDRPTAIGLLHAIFDADVGPDFAHGSYERERERICFLIDLADGHELSDQGPDKVIRETAFIVLATKYLKRVGFETLGTEILEKLLWFFRPMDHYSQRNVVCFGKVALNNYPMEVAGECLERFCETIWRETRYPTEIRAAVLELYYAYNRIGDIRIRSFPYDWELFTDDMVAKLEELALRDAPTVAAGVVAGKPAALLLVHVQTAREEIARTRRRKELEQTVAGATAELKSL